MRFGRTAGWALLAVACLMVPALAGNTETTRRSRNDVREGPGSYYPLVCVLPVDTPVEVLSRRGGWAEIRLPAPSPPASLPDIPQDTALWIAANCFCEKPSSAAPRELSFPWESLSASPSAVAAAVRGFALRFAPASEGSLEALEAANRNLFTPEEMERFLEQSRQLARQARPNPVTIPTDPALEAPCEVTLAEAGVGQAVSARIAERGLCENRDLQAYTNMIAAWLAEHTGAYDVPFAVYVVQGDDLYAMAVPGGKIFLTEGMVRACGDEAELAAVIAHEMMHVILRHGVQEIGERPVQIKADLAMRELDATAGKPPDPVMEGLERYAADAYESVSKPRLQAYEIEADRGALLVLARSGYDPAALVRMVRTVRDRMAAGGPDAPDNPFIKMDFEDRARHAASFAQGSLPGVQGALNRERFLKHNTSGLPPATTPDAPTQAPSLTPGPQPEQDEADAAQEGEVKDPAPTPGGPGSG